MASQPVRIISLTDSAVDPHVRQQEGATPGVPAQLQSVPAAALLPAQPMQPNVPAPLGQPMQMIRNVSSTSSSSTVIPLSQVNQQPQRGQFPGQPNAPQRMSSAPVNSSTQLTLHQQQQQQQQQLQRASRRPGPGEVSAAAAAAAGLRVEFHEVNSGAKNSLGYRMVYSDEMYMTRSDWEGLPKVQPGLLFPSGVPGASGAAGKSKAAVAGVAARRRGALGGKADGGSPRQRSASGGRDRKQSSPLRRGGTGSGSVMRTSSRHSIASSNAATAVKAAEEPTGGAHASGKPLDGPGQGQEHQRDASDPFSGAGSSARPAITTGPIPGLGQVPPAAGSPAPAAGGAQLAATAAAAGSQLAGAGSGLLSPSGSGIAQQQAVGASGRPTIAPASALAGMTPELSAQFLQQYLLAQQALGTLSRTVSTFGKALGMVVPPALPAGGAAPAPAPAYGVAAPAAPAPIGAPALAGMTRTATVSGSMAGGALAASSSSSSSSAASGSVAIHSPAPSMMSLPATAGGTSSSSSSSSSGAGDGSSSDAAAGSGERPNAGTTHAGLHLQQQLPSAVEPSPAAPSAVSSGLQRMPSDLGLPPSASGTAGFSGVSSGGDLQQQPLAPLATDRDREVPISGGRDTPTHDGPSSASAGGAPSGGAGGLLSSSADGSGGGGSDQGAPPPGSFPARSAAMSGGGPGDIGLQLLTGGSSLPPPSAAAPLSAAEVERVRAELAGLEEKRRRLMLDNTRLEKALEKRSEEVTVLKQRLARYEYQPLAGGAAH